MAEYAITAKGLTKRFGSFTAVDRVSFNVRKGELFGFLGPNGAGKTTTIRMLTTILPNTSGSARVAGYDIRTEQNSVRQSIGIVFQDPSLDDKLTGRENLDLHGMLYGMPRRERRERIGEMLKLVELEDKANILIEDYSGGMKRRLEIGRGLMHEPVVLFLDEPTIGLDAQTRRKIWEYIKRLNQERHITILLTTHYIEEADFLCDRVAFVDHGKIVALDTPKALKDSVGGDVVSLEYAGNSEAMKRRLKPLQWVKKVTLHDSLMDLSVRNGETRIPELLDIAEKSGVKVLSVNLHKPSLEDVFIHYTGKAIREEEGSSLDRMRTRMRSRNR
jgi:ABC-2 type transport system ATP-binding protein